MNPTTDDTDIPRRQDATRDERALTAAPTTNSDRAAAQAQAPADDEGLVVLDELWRPSPPPGEAAERLQRLIIDGRKR